MSAILNENTHLEEIYTIIETSRFGMKDRISSYLFRRNNDYGNRMREALCTTLVQGVKRLVEEEVGEDDISWGDAGRSLRRGYNSRFSSPVPQHPNFFYPTTLEDVRKAVEQMLDAVQKEHQEDYAEDPSWYTENPFEVHPWGDTATMIRTWINSDPFVFYCVGESLKDRAALYLEDYIVDMADGRDDGNEVSECVRTHFMDLMKRFQNASV